MAHNLVSLERLKLVPCTLFVAWSLAYLSIGLCAIEQDWGLADTHCGKTMQIFKFCALNLTFAFVDLISYMFFPGGGEGARARATMVSAMYFAFLVWGSLMWLRLDGVCSSVLGGQSVEDYTMILSYHHVATIHNGVMLALMIFHEAYLGRKCGYDFTIRPVQGRSAGHFTDKQDALGAKIAHHPHVQAFHFDGVQEVPPDVHSPEGPPPTPPEPMGLPPKSNPPYMNAPDFQDVYAVLDTAQP